MAGINAYVDWLGAHPDQMPLEFKLLGYGPSKWEAGDVVRIRSHGLTRNLTSEVARANTVCKTDPQNGPKYDQIRVGLQPAWETKVPEGLDPCLPKDVLRVVHTGDRRSPHHEGGVNRAATLRQPSARERRGQQQLGDRARPSPPPAGRFLPTILTAPTARPACDTSPISALRA